MSSGGNPSQAIKWLVYWQDPGLANAPRRYAVMPNSCRFLSDRRVLAHRYVSQEEASRSYAHRLDADQWHTEPVHS